MLVQHEYFNTHQEMMNRGTELTNWWNTTGVAKISSYGTDECWLRHSRWYLPASSPSNNFCVIPVFQKISFRSAGKPSSMVAAVWVPFGRFPLLRQIGGASFAVSEKCSIMVRRIAECSYGLLVWHPSVGDVAVLQQAVRGESYDGDTQKK
jgi:hypothetical protein